MLGANLGLLLYGEVSVMRFGETFATMQSVFTCYTVSDKTNGTVTETWILPFYFYSTFPWPEKQSNQM